METIQHAIALATADLQAHTENHLRDLRANPGLDAYETLRVTYVRTHRGGELVRAQLRAALVLLKLARQGTLDDFPLDLEHDWPVTPERAPA